MDSSADASRGSLDSTAAQQDDVEFDAVSMVNMFDELIYLEAIQEYLLKNAQHQAPFINNLTAVWDFDPRMRQAFASFGALVEANPTVDSCLKSRYEALVKLANCTAKAAAPRLRKSKRKLATAMRNNLIKAVLFADLRAEYLQEQLRMPTHLLSPEKTLELLGILPKESSNSTSSNSSSNCSSSNCSSFNCLISNCSSFNCFSSNCSSSNCLSSRSSCSSFEMLNSSCSSSMTADMSEAVRFKCCKMLCNALKSEQKAAELEAAIYAEFNQTNRKYKQRIRSRVSSLQDPRNRELRSSFLCGAISVEQLASKQLPQEGQHSMGI